MAELVAQLQAALHPTPGLPSTQSTAQLPLDLSSSSGSSGPGAQPGYPGYPSAAAGKQPWSSPRSAAAGGIDVQQAPVPRLLPALPSPSIGADTAVRTIDLDAGDWATGPSNGVPPGPPIAAGTAAAVARAMGAYPKGALPPAASIGLESAQQGPSSSSPSVPSVPAAAVRPPLGGAAATPVSGRGGGGSSSSSRRGGGSAAGGDISRGGEPSSGLMEEPPSPGEPPPSADLINTLMPLLVSPACSLFESFLQLCAVILYNMVWCWYFELWPLDGCCCAATSFLLAAAVPASGAGRVACLVACMAVPAAGTQSCIDCVSAAGASSASFQAFPWTHPCDCPTIEAWRSSNWTKLCPPQGPAVALPCPSPLCRPPPTASAQ